MKALVVSNCATSAYVHGLQALFPDWEVRGAVSNLAEQWVTVNPNARFIEYLKDCDIYVGLPAARRRYSQLLPQRARRVLLPPFSFKGLQPDSFHLTGFVSVLGIGSDLYSRIVVAAFRDGWPAARVCDRFNPSTYEALGFFTEFERERCKLIETFRGYGIDLSGSIERWVARGSFVYSYNHPRIDVLMEILRRGLAGAGLLDADAAERDDGLDVPDALAELIMWPVYPEIARRHGLDGSLLWRRGRSNQYVTLTLEQFVTASFEQLAGKQLPDLPGLSAPNRTREGETWRSVST